MIHASDTMATDAPVWIIVGLLFTLSRTDVNASSDSATSPAAYQLTELCPYSTFCTHVANRSLDDSDLQSCCLPCSCDPNCAIVGKCCPDATNIRPPTKVYPCRTQSEIYAPYLNKSRVNSNSVQMLRVIDGCPDAAHVISDLAESVARCYSAREVEDLAFATSTVSGLTYLNKHCARCNNDVTVTEWNLYALNRDVLSEAVTFEERDRWILSTGQVMSVPAKQELAALALCSIHRVNTCNGTGRWDVYDAELENKCISLGESMEFSEDGHCHYHYCNVYANVFCYLCNQPKGSHVQTRCSRADLGPDSRGGIHGPPFSALLTVTPKAAADKKTGCAIGEILNPYHMTCVQLYCPIGTAAQHGECVPLVEDELGYTISLAMELEFYQNPAPIDSDTFTDIVIDVAKIILRRVNNQRTACSLCVVDIIEDTKTNALYAATDLLTTSSCRSDALLQGISRLFSTSANVNVVLPSTQLYVMLKNVRGAPIPDIDVHAKRHVFETFSGFCRPGTPFLVNETIVCPSIVLGYEDMRVLGRHGNAFDLISSRSVDVGDSKSRICVDDYEAILRINGLISGERRQTMPTLLAILVAAFLAINNRM